MAKEILPTDYIDDVINEPSGRRRFNLIPNPDGTYSLEDVTNYSQIGSDYNAEDINATNAAVNESADKNKILDSLADIAANTQPGYMAGALAVSQINSNFRDYIKFVAGSAKVTVPASGGMYDIKLYDHIVFPSGYGPFCISSVDIWGISNGIVWLPITVSNDPKIRLINYGQLVYSNTVGFEVCFYKKNIN